MSENLAIFLVGGVVSVLISIIAFLAKLLLSQILSEIKSLRKDVGIELKEVNHDMAKVHEISVKNRTMLQNLPCHIDSGKSCIAMRG